MFIVNPANHNKHACTLTCLLFNPNHFVKLDPCSQKGYEGPFLVFDIDVFLTVVRWKQAQRSFITSCYVKRITLYLSTNNPNIYGNRKMTRAVWNVFFFIFPFVSIAQTINNTTWNPKGEIFYSSLSSSFFFFIVTSQVSQLLLFVFNVHVEHEHPLPHIFHRRVRVEANRGVITIIILFIGRLSETTKTNARNPCFRHRHRWRLRSMHTKRTK